MVAELFYPERDENKATHELVKEIGIVACKCWMKEFQNNKKATYHSFSETGGARSWANTTKEKHQHAKGATTTNDLAEHGFGALTHRIQKFNRIEIGNTAGAA